MGGMKFIQFEQDFGTSLAVSMSAEEPTIMKNKILRISIVPIGQQPVFYSLYKSAHLNIVTQNHKFTSATLFGITIEDAQFQAAVTRMPCHRAEYN